MDDKQNEMAVNVPVVGTSLEKSHTDLETFTHLETSGMITSHQALETKTTVTDEPSGQVVCQATEGAASTEEMGVLDKKVDNENGLVGKKEVGIEICTETESSHKVVETESVQCEIQSKNVIESKHKDIPDNSKVEFGVSVINDEETEKSDETNGDIHVKEDEAEESMKKDTGEETETVYNLETGKGKSFESFKTQKTPEGLEQTSNLEPTQDTAAVEKCNTHSKAEKSDCVAMDTSETKDNLTSSTHESCDKSEQLVKNVDQPLASLDASKMSEDGNKTTENVWKTDISDSVVSKSKTDDNNGGLGSSNNSQATSSQDQSSDQSLEKTVKYKCPKCSRVMKDKRLIDNHSCDSEQVEDKVKITITVENDGKSFVCKECNYSSSGHGFEEHLMCHLMVRPYQCLYCKECFINRKEISRHVLKIHNGAKMSCALRALRKAKGLIKEVTSTGIISFMAKVPGKVPLEKDPDKKKKVEASSVASSHVPETIEKQETKEQNSVENLRSDEGQALIDKDSATLPNSQGFSKLREVLTSSSSPVGSKETEEEGEEIPKADVENKLEIPNDESGLKIIAAFSLQEENESQELNTDTSGSEEKIEPNFFMSSPVKEKEAEPEILSFLGPDRPIYKRQDSSSLMLPPPPLQPAPSHSSNNNSNQLSHLGQRPKQPVKNSNFYVCGFNCLFSSLSTSEFREHTTNFHCSETYFPCFYCGHRSPNENDLVRHISNHTHTHNKSSPLYVCGNEGCRFGTNMVMDYINHIKSSHPAVSEPLCYSCRDTFPDVATLQTHVEENVIHIVNCPHCTSKATDRRVILNHISSTHPGKPKMVSVAKQLICNDRKVNNYEQMRRLRETLPPTLTPAPVFADSGSSSSHTASVIDQILSRHDQSGDATKSCGNSLSEILSSQSSLRDSPSPGSKMTSPSSRRRETTPDSVRSPSSESSDFSSLRVKEEADEDGESGEGHEVRTAYTVDEHGVRRRVYIPMSERQAENYRCKYCTFIARDLKRLNCHEKSHGMPPTRKERFKCMFCPQGFDSEMKFRLHITCHPGLIKFLLYRCKKCEFDTNQKHTIVKHITCNRDRKHRGFGPVEDQYTVVSRSLESRVLECESCDYMTRHKIHMAIHYQRQHNVLRDKSEFSIESLTPTDTPLSSHDLSPQDANMSSPFHISLQSPDTQSNSSDGMFDFTKPTSSAKKAKEKISLDMPLLSVSQITERNELFNRMVSQQTALQPGQLLENQMRKFKCPICKYLLPKAADLKNHVKRHSEIGQITLVMFRCKYCSCMSTARELLYEHLNEKHPGKPIALVKKIVAIDTTEVDKSFAETSMEESLDQLEESVHKEIMSSLSSSSGTSPSEKTSPNSSSNYEQLFVIPEGGETFSTPLQCPKCPFSSYKKNEIVHHVNLLHTEVKVIGSDEDVDKLARATTENLQQKAAATVLSEDTPKTFQTSQEDVLIVPDDQVFKEPAKCSRCDFATLLRKDMVLHLQQNHPDISVMGRNSYPVQVAAIGRKVGLTEESCVVGSGSLDAKIRCLYENYGTQMKCLICGTERPKKFFIHVHILRHLNIYLWKCAFCAHRGLQKYKMVDHIKKIHPGKAMSVRYLRVNVEAKVTQFLAQFSVIKNRKASLDEGRDVDCSSSAMQDDYLDQGSDDSSQSRQKSPGPGFRLGGTSPHTLGSEDLDDKINCLYDFSDGVFYKCIACPHQFQRRFAVHRHIIISHLKVSLLACTYCGMEGVEKHQVVDHILACHTSLPVSIQTLEVDLRQRVSDFLSKLAAGKTSGGMNDSDRTEINEIMKGLTSSSTDSKYSNRFGLDKSGKIVSSIFGKLKSPSFRFGSKPSGNGERKTKVVDPDVIMLGRDALDKELKVLYQTRPHGQLRCLVCRWEFPRKYPLHRHMMLKHLKLNLVGCPYCHFEGVEKYHISTHIKDEHKGEPISIKYTSPDVGSRVKQFIDDMANFNGQGQDLIKKPSSRDSSPVVVPKKEKDDDDENNEEEEKESGSQGGLVVAMFGKKKNTNPLMSDSSIVVKTEVEDEEYEEGSALPISNVEESEANDDNDNDYNEDDDPGADMSTYDPSDDSSSSTQHAKKSALGPYAPGSYRTPSGGKPKALDVVTKIKVLKSREGQITKFYCEQCKFTSLHRSNIVRHIYKIHEKYQTHTCPVCNYQTLSLMLMKKHLEKDHPGVEYIRDGFTINPPRSKPRSKPLMGPLSFQRRRQNLLNQRLSAKEELPSSSSLGTVQGSKQYACAYCHYETNTQEDILQHTRDNHAQGEDKAGESSGQVSPSGHIVSTPDDRVSACWDGSKKAVKRRLQDGQRDLAKRKRRFFFEKGDELIQCGHCDTRETSMGRMQDHLDWDHPGLPFQAKRIPAWRFVCKSCAVKTMATSKMKYHLNRHVNYRPYTCANCGSFFPSPDQCRRHSRSHGHEEQYTYVRNQKKETRVEELLEGTRQLALKIQEEAAKDPNFDISQTEAFISKFQDTKNNLKRSAPTWTHKLQKKFKAAPSLAESNEEDGGQNRKQYGKSPQTVGVEQDITVKCYQCEFKASNVHEVRRHHNEAHPGERFLWTEIERGFTCDSTGEALPECDSVPSTSLDVGYTTRMTLGAGNNTMRFKCKSCQFSSCVIQAMKSHLKSHQPKGFVCPYCSRSFSGKEKLMRHQYCLHKGQPLWVIHLRRSGVAGSTNTAKPRKKGGGGGSTESIKPAAAVSTSELADQETASIGKPPHPTSRRGSQTTTYLCSECSYTSESLYHFRLHLAQEHEEFTYKTQDTEIDSPLKCGYCAFLAETEADFSTHIETHFSARSFQCGYCDYSAYDRISVQRHQASNHKTLDAKIVDLGAVSRMGQEYVKGHERNDLLDLVNFEPEVILERLSDSILNQAQVAMLESSNASDNEDEVDLLSDKDETNPGETKETEEDEKDVYGDEDDDDKLMVVEGVSEVDMVDNEVSDDECDNYSEASVEQREEKDVENDNEVRNPQVGNFDSDLNPPPTTDSEELARQLGLVDDQTPSVLGSDSDMMIMQFGGIGSETSPENSPSLEGKRNTDSPANDKMMDSNAQFKMLRPEDSSVIRSKDSTLLAAQQDDEKAEDDDEEEDEIVNFDNDITLASPLPMISLGDGVEMSPVAMDEDEDNSLEETSLCADSEILLDV